MHTLDEIKKALDDIAEKASMGKIKKVEEYEDYNYAVYLNDNAYPHIISRKRMDDFIDSGYKEGRAQIELILRVPPSEAKWGNR